MHESVAMSTINTCLYCNGRFLTEKHNYPQSFHNVGVLIVSCLRTRIIIYNQDLVAGLLWKVELLYPTLQPLQPVVVVEQANVRIAAQESDVVPVD